MMEISRMINLVAVNLLYSETLLGRHSQFLETICQFTLFCKNKNKEYLIICV